MLMKMIYKACLLFALTSIFSFRPSFQIYAQPNGDEYKVTWSYIHFSELTSIKDSFYQSVNYDPVKGLLSFTIPNEIPDGYRFYLHVSGRMYMNDESYGMSFHAFDEESRTYNWEKGRTYTYSLKSEYLDECLLVFSLIDKNNQELLYAIHIAPDGAKYIESTD